MHAMIQSTEAEAPCGGGARWLTHSPCIHYNTSLLVHHTLRLSPPCRPKTLPSLWPGIGTDIVLLARVHAAQHATRTPKGRPVAPPRRLLRAPRYSLLVAPLTPCPPPPSPSRRYLTPDPIRIALPLPAAGTKAFTSRRRRSTTTRLANITPIPHRYRTIHMQHAPSQQQPQPHPHPHSHLQLAV